MGNISRKDSQVSRVHWRWVRGRKYNFSLRYVKFEVLFKKSKKRCQVDSWIYVFGAQKGNLNWNVNF